MDKVPTDFRRVTMLVSRIEPALEVYRDILGMQLHYDQEIVVSGRSLPVSEPNARARLVILKCNDPDVGMLGMLSYIDQSLPEAAPRPRPNHLQTGDTLFVMQNENVEAAYQRLKDVEGVQIVAEPHITEFPRGDGGAFRVEAISFFDPNGYFVELNQIVE